MIHIGLIGCGRIAQKHVVTLAKFDHVKLVAVSDLNNARMQEIAQLYKNKNGTEEKIEFYNHYNELLKNPKIDVVVIAVVSGLHAQVAKEAVKHGKHVIIEKPFALSLKEMDEVIQLGEDLNKNVFVCHQLRYKPIMQKIKRMIEEGYLGHLYFGIASMKWNRSEKYYTSSPWKGTWDKDGGMLVNQGIHLVDLLIWFLGEPKSVYGEIARFIKNKETEDVATGILSFRNQAKGVIESNIITKPKSFGSYLSLFGEKGTICIGGSQLNEVTHCYIEGHPEKENEIIGANNETDEHYTMYQDFIFSINNNQSALMSGREGKKAVEAIFAIYQSHLQNKPIPLPLEMFSTMDMSINTGGDTDH